MYNNPYPYSLGTPLAYELLFENQKLKVIGQMISHAKGQRVGLASATHNEYQGFNNYFTMPLPRGNCKSLYREFAVPASRIECTCEPKQVHLW